ncbi:abscisic-aldehyde oxidase-like [Tripterygium wilfordii]|uniref:Abscisic-aldehyde oxidase-like n=1 Tax=Tripterygium wilfordii TaxID=458696 RepID=A0A7J7C063_TRIWF|nr:abscisic-aldehyde oxidase-like [Tripterygium wilfordii]
MKLETEATNVGSLVFAVNGERFELSSVDPSTTLIEFLRYQTRFKSVKLGCGEGGCGACVVLLSKYDPILEQVDDFTVTSCLTLLCSVNGCSITTSDGFGNSKDGFHPIHERFSGFHASQCGFCTPGICVSLFSALVNAEKTSLPDPSPGFSKLTASEAEVATVGHLCRCTGYRTIADACKSFAADVDIEDLGLNSFWKKGDSKEVSISRLPGYVRNNKISTFPEFLKGEIRSAMRLDSKKYSWYNPVSVDELQSLLKTVAAKNGTRVKLVVGDTGKGYYKETEQYDVYINLSYLPELSGIWRNQNEIEIGAAVTISKAIEALKEENNAEVHSKGETVFKKLAAHMEKIASKFLRNTASVGGNLVLAQRKSFPSDIATVLLAVDSLVKIKTGTGLEKLSLEEFLGRPPLDSESVLLSVTVTNRNLMNNSSSKTDAKLVFETYRAAPRPLGNALPYLNAAFLAEVSRSKSANGIMLNNCRLAFGAYGTKHAIRARKVEEYLDGKKLTVGVLYEALMLVNATVKPEDGTSSPAYRTGLATGFLFRFLSLLTETGTNSYDVWLDGYDITSMSEAKQNHEHFDHVKPRTLFSSGKQVFEVGEEYRPVGEPITKSGAAIQASGETVYVDDIPSPPNCLYGAFIYSTKPLARVKGVEFKSKSIPNGVIGLISFKDIPEAGENIGSQFFFGIEPLFADEITRCAGQTIAIVVADTQKHADMAAKLAVVHYDTENLEAPVLSVEDAVKISSFFEVPPIVYPKQVGDFSKGMAEGDHKILSAKIILGSQYYFYMETQTALAIPDEDNCMVCKTNCSSKSAMRAPGEVQGSFIAEAVIEHVAATLSMDVDSVRQINFHTYNSLNLFYEHSSGEFVEYTLASIWDKLEISSRFKERFDMANEFNKHNVWQKRGISRVPCVMEVRVGPSPGKMGILRDGSIVVEVGGVEIGQGLWTKVKQMAAYALSLIKCGGSEELLEKVRVIQCDTLSLIQGGLTAGSTTSEASCEAVRLCCKILVDRLSPLNERLQQQMGSINWEMLIQQASLQNVNLSASSYFVPEPSSSSYLNYGAAVSEVEVNLLTGETTILRSDIIYDCGKSLNPAVDLGQIEGAFVQGIGFFMFEEYLANEDGLVVVEGPLTYKIPTIDTIPRQFNVEVLNSGHHQNHVLSSKASGEPPLLLATSVHCATRAAIKEARRQLFSWKGIERTETAFQLPIPATMPVVKELCGLDMVESYLQWKMKKEGIL